MKHKKENILGPFAINAYLGLIALTDDYLYLIRLNFIAQLKYSINQQIPFLYFTYFEKLKSKSLKELSTLYQTKRIRIDKKLHIKVKRSKFWQHKIYIDYGIKRQKWLILQRDLVDYYEEILVNELKIKHF